MNHATLTRDLRATAERAWDATCESVRWAIGAAIEGPKLARQRGKTANETKVEFFSEIAKESYIAGYERGFRDASDR